jgi:hypothetical protein
MIDRILETEHRFYNVPPEGKSLEACAEHACQHAAYGWGRQIDPRWSDEQKQAYIDAYRRANESGE